MPALQCPVGDGVRSRASRARRAAAALGFAVGVACAGGAAALDLPTLDKVSVMMSIDQVRYIAGPPDEMARVGPDLTLATWTMTGAPGMIAAGGIFDGRGLAAALALGADGVWVGTRFIATPEAHVVSGYREALVAGREDDTVITRAYTGKTLRAMRNDYTQHFEEHPDELQPFPHQIGRSLNDGAMHLGAPVDTLDVDPSKECFAAGQGVGAITAVVPAREIVRDLVAVAERTLARTAALTGAGLT